MTLILALVVGGLYAAGLYMMLRRSLIKILLGLALLSHGANLLIFTAGGLTRTHAPLLPSEGALTLAQSADPLPQALILTAIVISFAVLVFALALFRKTYETAQSDDVDLVKTEDEES
ncbi:MAG TPA: cation:proton antiporter [Verrucomicrobia bacterium]|nr:MAG: cation:proton antiporter [Lentisphaerae bacterium GWF2_57_35]HBA84439.1 cation:proton antiporter [Verrucomicrobiota bacterium]